MTNNQRVTIFILVIAALVVWGMGLRAALRPGARADQESSVSAIIVDTPAGTTPEVAVASAATPTPSLEKETATPTQTKTPTTSPTATATQTSSPTPSPTATSTHTPSPSPTTTSTYTPSPTPSPTATATRTSTPSPTATSTHTPSPTRSPTATSTYTPSPTPSPTTTATKTPSPTRSPTATGTYTPSPTASPTSTQPPSPTPSTTATATNTPQATSTPTATSTQQPTPTSPISAPPGIPQAGRFLLVNQDEQVMHVYEDGLKIRTILISSGRPVANAFTPAWRGDVGRYWGGGAFLNTDLFSDYMWYLFPGARGSILIHSVPYSWDGNRKIYDQLEALGMEPTSHGCVRISPGDARWLESWNPVGVPIEITAWSGEIGPADESYEWPVPR